MTESSPALPADAVSKDAEGVAEQTISLYEIRQKIYPRSVHGWFQIWRWVLVWATQLVFYGLPWLSWNDRPALLFDLQARRFYIFDLVLYPQDFIYLTGLLIISALSLFLFTAVAGRLWCGYACPQTVYSEIFLWIERHIEGDRVARQRLDAAPLSAQKILRKGAKHAVWLALAFWTGITFVGYFSPIQQLLGELVRFDLGPWQTFWVLFYGFATYGNAGWMREQVCKYMCPYARFQSAMFDKDTLIIAYDTHRGEPRGSRGRKVDPRAKGLGDCIDCSLCVQVCPTGIDIRKGLQYECIGCAACVDVCDSVMDKMSYPRGLIRYSTQRAITERNAVTRGLQHVLRPRVLVYAAILTIISAALLVSLWSRAPFKVDIVRDRAALARIVPPGLAENVYQLQIMNATEQAQHYAISVAGLPGMTDSVNAAVEIGAAQSAWVPVVVRVPLQAVVTGSHPVHFTVAEQGEDGRTVVEKSVFLMPR